MSKRTSSGAGGGEKKEMGGAEKLRVKKKKMLQADAAKCTKLTDLFKGAGPSKKAADDTTAGGHGGNLKAKYLNSCSRRCI